MSEQPGAAPISPLMQELAGYIVSAPRRALMQPALEATKHHLLDTLAAMISGVELPPGKAAINYVRSLGGNRDATIVGTRLMRHHTEHVRGTFANPMTRPEVDEKCYDLIAPVLGARRGRGLCDAIRAPDKLDDVRKLRPLLRA